MAGTEAACSATELEKFLAKQEIPPEVVAFVVARHSTGRGLTSIADYASVFLEKDYKDTVITWILEHIGAEVTPEGRVQVARPRDEEAAMTDDDRSIDGQPPNKKKKGNQSRIVGDPCQNAHCWLEKHRINRPFD